MCEFTHKRKIFRATENKYVLIKRKTKQTKMDRTDYYILYLHVSIYFRGIVSFVSNHNFVKNNLQDKSFAPNYMQSEN